MLLVELRVPGWPTHVRDGRVDIPRWEQPDKSAQGVHRNDATRDERSVLLGKMELCTWHKSQAVPERFGNRYLALFAHDAFHTGTVRIPTAPVKFSAWSRVWMRIHHDRSCSFVITIIHLGADGLA
jgi:hypothetical protein